MPKPSKNSGKLASRAIAPDSGRRTGSVADVGHATIPASVGRYRRPGGMFGTQTMGTLAEPHRRSDARNLLCEREQAVTRQRPLAPAATRSRLTRSRRSSPRPTRRCGRASPPPTRVTSTARGRSSTAPPTSCSRSPGGRSPIPESPRPTGAPWRRSRCARSRCSRRATASPRRTPNRRPSTRSAGCRSVNPRPARRRVPRRLRPSRPSRSTCRSSSTTPSSPASTCTWAGSASGSPRPWRGGTTISPTSARSSHRKASPRTSPTSPWSRAPSRRTPTRARRRAGSGSSSARPASATGSESTGGSTSGAIRTRPLARPPATSRTSTRCSATGTSPWPATTPARARCCAPCGATAPRTSGRCAGRAGCGAETKNYVPLIHAAIVIAKAPERYGFMIDPDPVPESEPVSIAGAFDLRVIAECAGEPVETIRTLNPVLRRLATPADRTLRLARALGPRRDRGRLRQDAAAREARQLPQARGPPGPEPGQHRPRERSQRTRRGRGQRHAPGKRLRRGTELIIPIPAHTRVATARHERGLDASEGRRVRHRIKPGDTLVSIAAQYGTTVRELRTWNRLRNTRIAAGSVLTIYTGSAQD